MSVEISQADLLREWIEKKISEDYDYSKASYKKNDRIAFCKAYPEIHTTEDKIRKHYDKILKEVGPQKGKSHSEIGVKKPKVNQSMLNSSSDMNAIIEPKPQSEILQPGGGMPSQPQIAGMPGSNPNQPYVNPNMTVDSIGGLCQGMMAAIKSILPDLELLSDEEKKSIGAILLPPFSRISDERIQLYLFPIIGVLGIMGPKIAKARKIKKERNLKEKKVEKQLVKEVPKPKESKFNHNEEQDDNGEGKVGW